MVKITVKSTLPGKPVEVFKYIGDFLNVPKWDPGTIKVTLASKNNMQVGTKYDVVTLMDGKEEPMNYEIVELTENSVTLKGEGTNTLITTISTEIIYPKPSF
jgi:hypothetical protein